MVNNMTIKIGGEAGQGMDTSGAGFPRALVRAVCTSSPTPIL